MKLIIFIMLTATLSTIIVNAQDRSTRFIEQHDSRFVNVSLEQTSEMLLKALESDDPNMQATAIQTLRDLEIMFPDEKFSSFTEPLILNVKDEKEDIQIRLLSVLALENLHSDIGDAAIYYAATNTSSKSVKDLCSVLSTKGYQYDYELVKQ